MLGYVTTEVRGHSDRLLAGVAARLQAEGWPLAGAVQVNGEQRGAQPCDMDLHVLTGRHVVRISQSLGPLSRGCRLDAGGLEQAVGLVEAGLHEGARLLIVNKFGKQEAEGRGFRPLIGQALTEGIPVLTSVNAGNLAAFQAFAGEVAEPLPPTDEAVLSWCRTMAVPEIGTPST